MRRLRMYRALYTKELRFLLLPAVTLFAVMTGYLLFWLVYFAIEHFQAFHIKTMPLFFRLNRVVIADLLILSRAFLNSFLYIPAVLLGWSLISERLAKTRVTLASLPVRLDVPALMKCAAAETLGFVIAVPLTHIISGSMWQSIRPKQLARSLDMSETILYSAHLMVKSTFRDWFLIRIGQHTALMYCHIGMVFLADSIAETIGRFRVAVWTFTLIGCTALFIAVLDIVFPDTPVYFMFTDNSGMHLRANAAGLPGAALGLLFVAAGAFLTRYHEA